MLAGIPGAWELAECDGGSALLVGCGKTDALVKVCVADGRELQRIDGSGSGAVAIALAGDDTLVTMGGGERTLVKAFRLRAARMAWVGVVASWQQGRRA